MARRRLIGHHGERELITKAEKELEEALFQRYMKLADERRLALDTDQVKQAIRKELKKRVVDPLLSAVAAAPSYDWFFSTYRIVTNSPRDYSLESQTGSIWHDLQSIRPSGFTEQRYNLYDAKTGRLLSMNLDWEEVCRITGWPANKEPP